MATPNKLSSNTHTSESRRSLADDDGLITGAAIKVGIGVGIGVLVLGGAMAKSVEFSTSQSNEGSHAEVDTSAIESMPIQEYVWGLAGVNGKVFSIDVIKLRALWGRIDLSQDLPWTKTGVVFENDVPVEFKVTGDDQMNTHKFTANPDGTVDARIYIYRLHLTANYVTGYIPYEEGVEAADAKQPRIFVDDSVAKRLKDDNLSIETEIKAVMETCKLVIDDQTCEDWLEDSANVTEKTEADVIEAAKWQIVKLVKDCQDWDRIKGAIDGSIYKMVENSRGITPAEAKKITNIIYVDESGKETLKEPDLSDKTLYAKYVEGNHFFEPKDPIENSERGRRVNTEEFKVTCTSSLTDETAPAQEGTT